MKDFNLKIELLNSNLKSSGNSNQHQVNECDLMEGVYELRSGKWKRISN